MSIVALQGRRFRRCRDLRYVDPVVASGISADAVTDALALPERLACARAPRTPGSRSSRRRAHCAERASTPHALGRRRRPVSWCLGILQSIVCKVCSSGHAPTSAPCSSRPARISERQGLAGSPPGRAPRAHGGRTDQLAWCQLHHHHSSWLSRVYPALEVSLLHQPVGL